MTAIIRADYLVQVHPFISNKDARYYLRGAYIAPNATGGARIVGSDGHVLGIFHDANGVCDKADIWPISKELLAACKPARKNIGTRWLVLVDGRAVVAFGMDWTEALVSAGSNDPAVIAYQKMIKPIDGTFPDYMRVVPRLDDDKPLVSDSYNPALLARVFSPGKFDEFGANLREGVCGRLASDGIGNPAIVKVTDRADYFGVVMPMRVGCGVTTADRPAWMDGR